MKHLEPKRTKYRKSFTLFYKGSSALICASDPVRGVSHGRFALIACEGGRLSSQTIEAARRKISKIAKSGSIWVKVFAGIPITKKPAEVRMGKGKGSPAGWIATIKKGQVLFEMDGISSSKAKQAVELAKHKIGLKTKLSCGASFGTSNNIIC